MSGGISAKSLFALAAKIVSVLTSFVLGALATRMLSLEDAGIFFLASSVAAFFSIFSIFGFNQVAIRFIVRAETTVGETHAFDVAKTVGILSGITTIFVSILYVSGIGTALSDRLWHAVPVSKVSRLIALWIFFQAMQIMVADILRGFNKVNLATLYGGVISGISNALILGFIYYFDVKTDVTTFLCICIFSLAFSAALSAPQIKKIMKNGVYDLSRKNVSILVRTAAPIWAGNIAIFAVTQATVWIIAAIDTSDNVALFSAANRAAALLLFTSSVLYAVLSPVIARFFYENDFVRLETTVRRATTVNTIIILPIFIGIIFNAKTFLTIIFGAHYTQAYVIFTILAAANFFNLATGIRGQVLLMCGYQTHQLWISLIGGVLSLTLAFLGLKSGGIIWCAAGASIAVVTQCLMEMLLVKRKIGIYTHFSFHYLLTRK